MYICSVGRTERNSIQLLMAPSFHFENWVCQWPVLTKLANPMELDPISFSNSKYYKRFNWIKIINKYIISKYTQNINSKYNVLNTLSWIHYIPSCLSTKPENWNLGFYFWYLSWWFCWLRHKPPIFLKKRKREWY